MDTGRMASFSVFFLVFLSFGSGIYDLGEAQHALGM